MLYGLPVRFGKGMVAGLATDGNGQSACVRAPFRRVRYRPAKTRHDRMAMPGRGTLTVSNGTGSYWQEIARNRSSRTTSSGTACFGNPHSRQSQSQ